MGFLTKAVWRVLREIVVAMLIAIASELGGRRKPPKS